MIKLISTVLAAGFILTAGYSYSRAECAPDMDKATVMKQFDGRFKVEDITKSLSGVFEKKGNPPHAEGTDDLEGFLALSPQTEAAEILIFQHGCFVDMLGPARAENVLKLLDREGV